MTVVPERSTPVRALVVAVGAALVALVPAALLTGAVAPLALADAGPFVRWMVPVSDVVADLSSAATVGLLGFAAFLVPERARTDRRARAVRFAAGTATVWLAAASVQLVTSFADLAGTPLTAPGLARQLLSFTWSLEVTRVLFLTVLAALVVTVSARLVQRRAPMAWLTVLAFAGVVIQSLTGHAAGSASHEDAVNGLAFHLAGVVVWVGGLIALVVMRPALGRDLAPTVRRYSMLALWSYVAVGVSGLEQAAIRLGSPSGVLTAYGAVVVLKALVLAALGVLGWRQCRAIATRLAADPSDGRAFARLALTELVVMGVAVGLAAVLARSVPPVPDALPDPGIAITLTGYPDPGPVAGADWLLSWRMDWLFATTSVLAVGLYLAGFVRLRRRGDAWPVLRLVLWVAGWALFAWATCGAPGIWGRVLFSAHMVMHMAVAMVVPLLLVPAAPVTLALRALRPRRDRTWGPREVLLQVVHSRAMRVLANPVVAAALFFFSLAVFYFSGLFELALTTHTGHLLMMAHFLLTGYLFVWVMIGIDPGVPRWSPLMLLVILFATVSFHAFFGVVLTGSTTLLAPDFFTTIDLPWMTDPLADQHTAGEIAWGIGEAPTLVLAVVVAAQWFRRETLETARRDRQADRDGDAELEAYNARLARLREEAQHLEPH
ncbi:bifunctional copper resistance protein CopD/cytochrome c oxidase assembly protein [Phycicoccus endophyticus]|uniref:Bifunctional copper resistance protein CopD/cytochrome c oxidase assembly protein n=1 Tax=Phycicoccus endophyticus TaxID=1690220 RepID=A0A7G9R1F2_9MICO|nr:cytochrome c oxidase assembly protein [Phycicoccus endophyticus]NHI18786.1 bifunctional copper resistance protein CopD/cytochrome c oxidase assembly protein [Phycicoccus endophyticus]QNN49427.1 bifunctional copper resistance protein CopD/cytochrome c oxidase assembly protein [Phycicoccus endophyticus]GGL36574.1 copper resistance protein D [Phycicoccus endophyticus]